MNTDKRANFINEYREGLELHYEQVLNEFLEENPMLTETDWIENYREYHKRVVEELEPNIEFLPLTYSAKIKANEVENTRYLWNDANRMRYTFSKKYIEFLDEREKVLTTCSEQPAPEPTRKAIMSNMKQDE
jgi:hypothetical protein